MTTLEFIEKTFGAQSERIKECSSVFTDRDGNVYSYGYHYPLLFKVGGLVFVNTTGYSSTTNRHIYWAKQAVGYECVSVELNGDRLPGLTLERIRELLGAQVVEAKAKMDAKKRKNTQVYAFLENQYQKVLADYNKVVEQLQG